MLHLQEEEAGLDSLKDLRKRVERLVKKDTLARTVRVVLTGVASSVILIGEVNGDDENLFRCTQLPDTKSPTLSDLHAEFKFFVTVERPDSVGVGIASESVCLLDNGLEPQELQEAIVDALRPPNVGAFEQPAQIAFIYPDDDESVVVRVWITDVCFLHQLRDHMLNSSG